MEITKYKKIMISAMDQRRRNMLRVLWLGGLGGLAGCTTSEGDGPAANDGGGTDRETGIPEPEELPEGLVEDGIDVDVLHERVVREVTEGSFHAVGSRDRYKEDDEFYRSKAQSGRGNNDQRRGLDVQATDSGTEIRPDLTDAEDVDVDYYEGENEYENRNGELEADDGSFEEFTQRVVGWAEIVFTFIDGTAWESPEWNPEEGVYVVSAVEITDWPDEGDGPELLDGELHVDPDGLPVRLASRFDDGRAIVSFDGETETRTEIPIAVDEITFDAGDVTVEEPDWVEDVREG